jgi:hypothetical protein
MNRDLKKPKFSILDLIEILDGLKVRGTTRTLKIGENDYAMKQMNLTMEEIKAHNIEVDGWMKGHKEGVEKVNQKIQEKINEIMK